MPCNSHTYTTSGKEGVCLPHLLNFRNHYTLKLNKKTLWALALPFLFGLPPPFTAAGRFSRNSRGQGGMGTEGGSATGSRSGSVRTAGQAAGRSSRAPAPDVAELPEESGLSAGVSTSGGTREESGLISLGIVGNRSTQIVPYYVFSSHPPPGLCSWSAGSHALCISSASPTQQGAPTWETRTEPKNFTDLSVPSNTLP